MPEEANSIVTEMAHSISHRGPDDWGVSIHASVGLALAHRRLSILDLSAAGHQPMMSESGQFTIAFNGEIYNHLELRKRLNGIVWRGHSDTETLLSCFESWGVDKTIEQAVGMFSIALFDEGNKSLYLIRDRMGEKPLYYGWQGGTFLFGSELKCFRSHPDFHGQIDRDSLTQLLRHNYIPGGGTIFQNVRKLPPGTMAHLSLSGNKINVGTLPPPRSYWTLSAAKERGLRDPYLGSDRDAVNDLENTLRLSTEMQMIADVPIGAFLSGGIDSSLIVALMQKQARHPVQTFTIGFEESGYNEAHYAKKVAEHLGTEHTELCVTSQEALSVIPKLPEIYDEPFADASQVPTVLVSALARRNVKVILSGDGGDELFGGYNRYFLMARIRRALEKLPRSLRYGAIRAIHSVSPGIWDSIYNGVATFMPQQRRSMQLGDKLYKLAEILELNDARQMYLALLSQWKSPAQVVCNSVEPETQMRQDIEADDMLSIEQSMMFLDSKNYLPDDILVKVDRAAMSVSLETRMPFLDHRLVELAWRLPLSMKIREGKGKWILREILNRYLPTSLIDRPKMGFGVPIDSWLRGPLREWAENLLEEKRLEREGFFIAGPIREKWLEHLSGKRNWQYYLWSILMFQSWLEAQTAK